MDLNILFENIQSIATSLERIADCMEERSTPATATGSTTATTTGEAPTKRKRRTRAEIEAEEAARIAAIGTTPPADPQFVTGQGATTPAATEPAVTTPPVVAPLVPPLVDAPASATPTNPAQSQAAVVVTPPPAAAAPVVTPPPVAAAPVVTPPPVAAAPVVTPPPVVAAPPVVTAPAAATTEVCGPEYLNFAPQLQFAELTKLVGPYWSIPFVQDNFVSLVSQLALQLPLASVNDRTEPREEYKALPAEHRHWLYTSTVALIEQSKNVGAQTASV